MYKIPEKFYTSFKAPYSFYNTDKKFIEVFINPSIGELREIESFPTAKFAVSDNKAYFFNADVLHSDVLFHIKEKIEITGDFDFSKREFYVYDQQRGAEKLSSIPYIKMRFTGFEIKDYSLRTQSYGIIKMRIIENYQYATVMVPAEQLSEQILKLWHELRSQVEDNVKEDEDLDEPHITVLYGFPNDSDYLRVLEDLNGFGPIDIRVTGWSYFINDEGEVLKFDVESDRLEYLHNMLKSKYENHHRYDYKPHITIGYLKSQSKPSYQFKGNVSCTIRNLVWSSNKGKIKYLLPLE
jgi:2'-5' RNA ligase